jgi:Tfp pilus assembly protein PilO
VKRSLLIGIVAGAVVLLLIWYFALFSPTSKDLSDTRAKVASTKSANAQLQDTVRRLKELSANAAQQAATLQRLRAAVPQNPDLGQFILQANDLATAAGIDWLSIAPSPPTASAGAGPKSTIALSMQVSGGFFEVLDYLNRLEKLDRLVIVDTINVSSGGNSSAAGSTTVDTGAAASGGGAPDLGVTLTGRMFSQAAPPAGSVPGGTAPSTPGATTPTTPTTAPASSSGTSS